MNNLLNNQRGSVHILVFGLFGAIFVVLFSILVIKQQLYGMRMMDLKTSIDIATKAAAFEVDPISLSNGILAWDRTKGTETFFNYLRANLGMDPALNDAPYSSLIFPYEVQIGTNNKSYLKHPLILHSIEFVQRATYPSVYTKTFEFDVNDGASSTRRIRREVTTTIYGPAVVAVVEIRDSVQSDNADKSIIQTSVANVRFVY